MNSRPVCCFPRFYDRACAVRPAAVAALALILSGGAVAAAAAAGGPSAQLFDAVKKPESVDAQWRANVCALLPEPCQAESLGLYRPRGAAADNYVVLAEKPLAMARLRHGASGWQLDRLYDFTHYRHSSIDNDPTREAGHSIAPALYPLAEGRWAVALLETVTESYSGGGAAFSTADFVPLEAAAPADGKAVEEDVPFSCSKVVRACFSEKEYRTSPHCHDESSGSLRIAYGKPAQAGAPYRWQYTWLESDWAAHKPKSSMQSTTTRFTADATSAASGASFCDGPQ